MMMQRDLHDRRVTRTDQKADMGGSDTSTTLEAVTSSRGLGDTAQVPPATPDRSPLESRPERMVRCRDGLGAEEHSSGHPDGGESLWMLGGGAMPLHGSWLLN